MEKLVELLNEYENQLDLKWCTRSEQPNFIWHIKAVSEYSDNILYNADLAVTSKRYWFIKWLVENDKIDSWTRNPLFITELVGEQEKQIPYSFYEEMLIRLALSENPIEDLISYLDLSKS